MVRYQSQPRRKPNRQADLALVVVLVFLSFISIAHCLYATQRLLSLQNYHTHMDRVMGHHMPHSPVAVDTLPLESRFRQTVRTCIPTLSPHKCPEPIHDVHNVALVAPPGEFSQWIFDWAQGVIQDSELGLTTHMHISLVSHVPPLAVHHGYTKVIRILPQSLLLGAADALRGTLELGKTPQVLRLADLKASLLLLLRYHCRISQMALHTPVLTLDMNTVARAPRIAREGLLNFLNITARDHGEWSLTKLEKIEQEDQANSRDTAGLFEKYREKDMELLESSQSLQSYASSLLTWISKNEHVQIQTELNKVLQDELESSDDFSRCHSFWNITDMSVFSRILAMSLAPDCTTTAGAITTTTIADGGVGGGGLRDTSKRPSVCTHPRDLCEEKGDAICKGRPPYPTLEELQRSLPGQNRKKKNQWDGLREAQQKKQLRSRYLELQQADPEQ